MRSMVEGTPRASGNDDTAHDSVQIFQNVRCGDAHRCDASLREECVATLIPRWAIADIMAHAVNLDHQ